MPAPETPPAPVQNGGGGPPRATLVCRPNSHPFNDRNLVLDQEIKIGRSVARAKTTLTNAIFDCKVLSRNHAVLWYSLGKFYLQDTKSSNGTFVNNQRLSKGAEESAPREVCSGDILQFGVDVMENSRKVTHGCIIATLKLFLPDGKEAKASPSIVNSTNSSTTIPPQDLYQLNTFIQESLAREQLLENKLILLQGIVAETQTASKNGWRALMEEDRLLTRVEILENQLSTYGKSMSEEKLREEAKRLMEDKEKYQLAAKDSLKQLLDQKMDAENKLKETETALGNMEDEFTSLKTLYHNILDENTKLSEKISSLSEDLNKRIQQAELLHQETEADLNIQDPENKKDLLIEDALSDLIQNGDPLLNGRGRDDGEVGGGGEGLDDENELDTTDRMISDITDRLISDVITDKMASDVKMVSSTDSLDGSKPDEDPVQPTDAEQKLNEANRMRGLIEDLMRSRERDEAELTDLRDQLLEARTDNATVLQELNKTKALLEAAEQSLEAKSLGVNAAIANTGTVASEDADKPVPERGLETQLTLKPQSSQQEMSAMHDAEEHEKEQASDSGSHAVACDVDHGANNTAVAAPSTNTGVASGAGGVGAAVEDIDDPDLTLRRPAKKPLPDTPLTLQDTADGSENVFFQLQQTIADLKRENSLLKDKLVEAETSPPPVNLIALGSPLAESSGAISSGQSVKPEQTELAGHPNQVLVPTSRLEMLGPDPVETILFAPSRRDNLSIAGEAINQADIVPKDLPSPDEVLDLVFDKESSLPAQQPGQGSLGDLNKRQGSLGDGDERQNSLADVKEHEDSVGDPTEHRGSLTDIEEQQGSLAERLERVDPLDISDGLNISYSSSDLSTIERALSTAEDKIAKLLKVKEKLVAVQTEKLVLEDSIHELEENLEALSVTSRVLTFVNIVPLLVLLVCVVLAFLPSISTLLGTRDTL